jgi:gluconolactonase
MLLAAEHSGRRISRAGAPVATLFEGKRFNSPNDLVAAPDGTIYFTDPPYGLQGASELGFMGVFRVAPNGTVTAEHRGPMTARPNGIGLGLGASLYMADTADGNLYEFPINVATGALGPRRVLAATSGGPDGLAIDLRGNIFVTTSTGVEVFAPSGSRWGVITVPQQPSNCAFGDADHKTLYITARTAVYRVRLAEPGRPRD